LNLKELPTLDSAAEGALRTAFQRQKIRAAAAPAANSAERVDRLQRLERMLLENEGAIVEAIARDFGTRSKHETQLLELFPSLEAVRHARRHVARWMRPQHRGTNLWFLPGRSRIVWQPLGVVGIIVPWNYPIYLAVGPLASAIAAGNRVLVKMSELAPATGALFASLVARFFPPEELTVVNGGPDVARAFSRLPFDHLLFTGSTAVGREVMRAAAENLTPVTLELGGKSPAIVGPGFRMDEAAARVLFGKCLNAGQTCVAPDYVLVPENCVDAFVDEARKAVARFYPTLKSNPDYTAIVNDRHRERLQGYLREAQSKGARVVELNPANEDLEGSGKLAPSLLVGVTDSMAVMREEIFGPLLPVVPYHNLESAIAYVNARPRPLALYVFEHDREAVERVIEATVSGGVTVNETILHVAQDDLPFGGVGPSGMGHYHGREGFETFSKKKAVFLQSRLNGLKLFRPPYGRRFEALVRLLLR
jgi:coniferyl-aldehyde dehydrogenase